MKSIIFIESQFFCFFRQNYWKQAKILAKGYKKTMVISLNKTVFIYEKCYSCNYIVIGYYLKDNDISKCNRILTSRNSPEGTVPF